MNCVRRHKTVGIAVLLLWAGGCTSRPAPSTKPATGDNRDDGVATALARLERDNDPETCRDVLAALDAITQPRESRPDPSPAEIKQYAAMLKLTPAQAEGFASPTFTNADGDYLADCFILRDAIESLEIGKLPPRDQAVQAFDWVCRQVYLTRQSTAPAPAWWLLQAGMGTGLDRTYLFLGMLQQLNLQGYLIGPPELAQSPAFNQNALVARQNPFPPIRTVGVQIGNEVLLFDPRKGEAVGGPDMILTLSAIRSDPSRAKEWLTAAKIPDDEVKRWQLFVAAPIQSFQPRTAWLQRQLTATATVALAVDLRGVIEKTGRDLLSQPALAGMQCLLWNPANDPWSLVNIVTTFSMEARNDQASPGNVQKAKYMFDHFPWQFLPRLSVDGAPLSGEPQRIVGRLFESEFKQTMFATNSPRDNLVRGNFSSAIAALTEVKDRNQRIRDVVTRTKITTADVEEWSKAANNIFAAVLAAEESGDAAALHKAMAKQSSFVLTPQSEKIALLIRRQTSTLLNAQADYELAMILHERAVRALLRWKLKPDNATRTEAERLLSSAIDGWQRYLDNHPELREEFADRDQHARSLQKQARATLAKR